MTVAPVETLDVSVLVPAKDEADNLPEFVQRCAEALRPAGFSFEVIVVNDGSRDGTDRVLRELARQYPFLSVVTHRRQRGIADALRSAGDVARGRRLRVLSRRPAVPAGGHSRRWWRRSWLARPTSSPAPSRASTRRPSSPAIYNGLCRWLFGVRVTDLNSVKAYRREVMHGVPLRPDWHRYMVVIAAAEGYPAHLAARCRCIPAGPGPRSSTGGGFRSGVFDLISVWFQLRFGRKPMLFFGVGGAVLFVIGLLAGIVALVLRFGYGIGLRPLLNLVETMVISGIVLFGFGFLGEMIAGMREETREIARELARIEKPDVRD